MILYNKLVVFDMLSDKYRSGSLAFNAVELVSARLSFCVSNVFRQKSSKACRDSSEIEGNVLLFFVCGSPSSLWRRYSAEYAVCPLFGNIIGIPENHLSLLVSASLSKNAASFG